MLTKPNDTPLIKIKLGWDNYLFLPATKENLALVGVLAATPIHRYEYLAEAKGEKIGTYFHPEKPDYNGAALEIEILQAGRVKFAPEKLKEDPVEVE